MRQRVGIARAFALSPKMLLLDEPFGMLDSLTRVELQQVLIELWRKDRKTALMVTHDVDEALFLSDRIVMMTNGPAAEVGDILEVNFPRPRDRKSVLEHPDYYRLREHLITFLEVHAYRGQREPDKSPPPTSGAREVKQTAKVPSRLQRAGQPWKLFVSASPSSPNSAIKPMKPNQLLTTSALVLAASASIFAQTNTPAPPPPAKPGPGLVNEWLRKENPDNVAWDIGGQVRARYEIKEGFGAPIATGLPGAPGPADFRDVGGNKENVYLLLREKVHVGYTQPWWSVYVEARDSGTYFGDDRQPDPETDRIDLHQAYLTVGNRKESPFSIKVGRQELGYGDERLVGTFDWNNIGRVFDTAKFRFETKDVWVDAFVSRPVLANDGRFNTWNDYETFSGVYASTKTLIPKQETQVYFLARNTGLKSPSPSRAPSRNRADCRLGTFTPWACASNHCRGSCKAGITARS